MKLGALFLASLVISYSTAMAILAQEQNLSALLIVLCFVKAAVVGLLVRGLAIRLGFTERAWACAAFAVLVLAPFIIHDFASNGFALFGVAAAFWALSTLGSPLYPSLLSVGLPWVLFAAVAPVQSVWLIFPQGLENKRRLWLGWSGFAAGLVIRVVLKIHEAPLVWPALDFYSLARAFLAAAVAVALLLMPSKRGAGWAALRVASVFSIPYPSVAGWVLGLFPLVAVLIHKIGDLGLKASGRRP